MSNYIDEKELQVKLNQNFEEVRKDFIRSIDEVELVRITRNLSKEELRLNVVNDTWLLTMIRKVIFDDDTNNDFKVMSIKAMLKKSTNN